MMNSDPPSAAQILDDPEWVLLQTIEELAIDPLGVAAEEGAIDGAARRTGYDAARIGAALSTLIEKHVLVGFGEGAVQITQLGRDLLAARRI